MREINKKHSELQKKIEADVMEFLKSGGEIQKIRAGKSAESSIFNKQISEKKHEVFKC